MLKKLWTSLLSSAALITLAATFFLSFASPLASAAAPTPRDTYSAGTKELGGDICSCPILVGNCACRIKGVSPFEEADAESE